MDTPINIKRLPPPNNIKILNPKSPNQLVVTWDMARNPDNVAIFYNIYRGISMNGIFYKQNSEVLKTNRYEDNNVGRNPNVTYWYKISTLYELNGTYVEGPLSPPVIYHVTNTNKWFNKINERNMWILKNTGQLFDLYTRKYEGPQCPKCYSPERGRAGDSSCTVCYGTGIEGGYEPMFQLYIRLKPVQTELALGNNGYIYNNNPGAWTISSIMIKNRDILISPQGIIYSVLSSHVNQAAGYLFHQELQLKELDPMDPLYQIQRATLHPNI